jgi:superfamily II DNA or RNA helicase
LVGIEELGEGAVVEAPFFEERVRILSVRDLGGGQISVVGEGLSTRKVHRPVIPLAELGKLRIVSREGPRFDGDPEGFFLFMEALRMRSAYQFDPLYAVNVSMVDPLPHQIEAVYHHILKNPDIRFLLADDPGAGKTVMAGLLLKELKYRGLVERVLILVPGHLKDQWVRELKEKFSETFRVVDRSILDSSWGRNVWTEEDQAISSMDFCKREEVMYTLQNVPWDLVIVDEAHKMSAYRYGEKTDKTRRYRLGELLSGNSRYLLFLTATPHRGDPENFRLFLDLLEPGFFSSTEMLSQSIREKDNPLFLRRLKEDLRTIEGQPIFPPRRVYTVKYRIGESPGERELYEEVTRYVKYHYNRALQKEKRNVAFALVILQRRLASSVRAIRFSLERRRGRLQDLLDKGKIVQEAGHISISEDEMEELAEEERWEIEEELVEKLTSADTLQELKAEIEQLDRLISLARRTERSESETKLKELRKVIETEDIAGSGEKLLIFTESRDTLSYLEEKLRSWGFSVTTIHGGMRLDRRIQAEAEFREKAQVMVATEAAGEGINLQFCHLCINYDIPWNPNRLEQRMGRVHRYGQRREVHIYNLVAVDTYEGRVLKALFDKLERMRDHLGSDRVFDVIGDMVPRGSLRELILEAISQSRSMEEILKDFEPETDPQTLERVREATLESLATRHMDLSRILGEQRRAKENKLVPEYVERFFQRAARALGISMERRNDGLWRITRIPFEVRNRPHSFRLRHGEVLAEYNRVSFDKGEAFNRGAVFVSMGHPLMEAVIDRILELYSRDAASGAVLHDPDGGREGLLWFLQADIKDGSGRTAGRRLFAVFEELSGRKGLVNPAILWDLKGGAETAAPPDAWTAERPATDHADVVTFVISQALEPYRAELLEARRRDAEIKRKYGLRSLEELIGRSEEKLADYYTRQSRGEPMPEVTIQQEKGRKEDLIAKRERLLRSIEAETHLLPQEPEVLGVARVVPLPGREGGERPDPQVELVGMRVAMEYEKSQGREPEDVSALNLGYDIRSVDGEGGHRYIEVKARAGEGAVTLTPNEWLMAHRLGEEYWLYVVSRASKSEPHIAVIKDPAAALSPEEEISIVRYVVKDWMSAAERVL